MGVTKGEFHWYSDGVDEVMLHVTEPVPANFIKGRSKSVAKRIQNKVSAIVNSRSSEEQEEINRKAREGIAKLSSEQRAINNAKAQAAAKLARENLSEERKEQIRKQQQANARNIAKNRSKESWEQAKIRRAETIRNRTPEKQQQVFENAQKGWANMSPEAREQRLKNQGEGVKRAFAMMPQERKQEIVEKVHNTKKQNGVYQHVGTSKQEDIFYERLLSFYDKEDIVRWYRDERYPFCCDFYVASKDLFIECNFFWTHNNHVFDKDDPNDVAELAKWQEKAKKSKFYKAAIYTWTDLDVRKYDTAKKNNLNYKVVYNGNEKI